MTSEDTRRGATFSDAAIREWSQHAESMMRGIAHALNNRAAALSAVLELSREADAEDAAAIRNILTTELSRVREVADAVRLAGPPRTGTEAFSPEDAVQQASSVLRLLVEHGDRVAFTDARGAPPIRVERWMFMRALVVLGVTARVDGPNTTVAIQIAGDGEWLEVQLDEAAAPASASLYVTELVRAMGGELLATRGFRVPTLASVRQREGR